MSLSVQLSKLQYVVTHLGHNSITWTKYEKLLSMLNKNAWSSPAAATKCDKVQWTLCGHSKILKCPRRRPCADLPLLLQPQSLQTDRLSRQGTAHYCDLYSVFFFLGWGAHLLPLKVSILARARKIAWTQFGGGAHSGVDTALKQADIMMSHIHDCAVSNGHVLTHCHVDLLHTTVTCLRMMRSS